VTRRGARHLAGLIAVTTALLVALSGCGSGGSAPPAPGPSATPTPSATASLTATMSAEPGLPTPPGAALAWGGGDAPVPGLLGTWTLDGNAVDSPWPAATALEAVEIIPGSAVTVGFDDGTPIGTWTARLADATDATGETAHVVGEADAAGVTVIQLPALPAGDWVLEVHLGRADGQGEASYYWAIRVG
jgi:hypothetical protein